MKTTYTVSSTGMSAADVDQLRGLLAASAASDRVYLYLGQNFFGANIIIVNADVKNSSADNPDRITAPEQAIDRARSGQKILHATAHLKKIPSPGAAVVKLPLVISRVIPMLDLLVLPSAPSGKF